MTTLDDVKRALRVAHAAQQHAMRTKKPRDLATAKTCFAIWRERHVEFIAEAAISRIGYAQSRQAIAESRRLAHLHASASVQS